MSAPIGGNTTLPSVGLSQDPAPADALVVTILFHPDITRIGQAAVLDRGKSSRDIVIGREQPPFEFRHGSERDEPRGLGDPHVSREALSIRRVPGGVRLSRSPGASRCSTVAGDIVDSQVVADDHLARGLALRLGHGIVLFLRYSPFVDDDMPARDTLELLGTSDSMARLRRETALISATDADVLITGDNGSGKELVAQALHRLSNRSKRPFVAVNVAALPTDLAAAALFGSARGAFTGATANREGYFQQAEGGTLFLDEIGDAAPALQPLLLRALQEREVQVVGGRVCKIDVRVIAATDADIDAPTSGFRAALRHRLAALELHVPPLRDHLEDIGLLAWHFFHRHLPQATSELSATALAGAEGARWAGLIMDLVKQRWEGNVRQLNNTMRQIAIESGPALRLPTSVRHRLQSAAPTPVGTPWPTDGLEISDQLLRSALSACDYEIAATARKLGVSRQSIYRRVQAADDLCLAADIPLRELLQALEEARGDLDATARALKVSATALRARIRTAPAAGIPERPD